MSPLDVVRGVFERFEPREPREAILAQALRDLVSRQAFHPTTGEMIGPRLDIRAIARHAALPRGLISHEGCELPRVRDMLIDALRLLSNFSLQVECDYLKEENKRLQMRLDLYDSGAANRVVSLFREQVKEGEKPKKRATAKAVRDAVIILPMSEL